MNRYPGIFFIRRLLSIACCLLFIASINAQKKPAFVSGKVLDENENPLSHVSVAILGRQTGIITSDSGTFRLQVFADKAFAVVCTIPVIKPNKEIFY